MEISQLQFIDKVVAILVVAQRRLQRSRSERLFPRNPQRPFSSVQVVSGLGFHSSDIEHPSHDALRCGWLADVTGVMRSSWTLLVGVVSTRFQDVITVSKKLGNTVQPVIGLDFFFICHQRCRQRCVVVGSGERKPAVVRLRMAADGPRSSGCGWPVVVRLRMARGHLRMAAVQSGRPPADGPWSSACGWPRVVCGWPGSKQGRLLADGPGVVCLRMAQGRLLADGRVPTRDVCLRMAQGRLLAAGFQPGTSACGWVVCQRMAQGCPRSSADGVAVV